MPTPITLTMNPSGRVEVAWPARTKTLQAAARRWFVDEVASGILPAMKLTPAGNMTVPDPRTVTQAAAEIEMWLRGHGFVTTLRCAPKSARLHHGCGRSYGLDSWLARPAKIWNDPAMGGYLEMRRCDCGSDITVGGMELRR